MRKKKFSKVLFGARRNRDMIIGAIFPNFLENNEKI
jgi:hypothetical protein